MVTRDGLIHRVTIIGLARIQSCYLCWELSDCKRLQSLTNGNKRLKTGIGGWNL